MQEIIEKICAVYSMPAENILLKSTKREYTNIRNYVYYILHYDYAYSVGQIAKHFKRCKREVNYRLSEAKYRISCVSSYKEEYDYILTKLNRE